MNSKVILLICVVVALLFIAVVAVGARGQGGLLPTVDLQANWAEWLRGRLTQKLRSSEMTMSTGEAAGCRLASTQIQAPENVICRLTIAANDRATRQLQLALTGADATVMVTLEQPNALRIEETLTLSTTATPLDIYRNADNQAAFLTLSNCQVKHGAEEKAEAGEAATGGEQGCVLEIR
ncbi:MAG: hypothetical protein R3C14_55020 [Caldilineaceae bacterium]